MGRHDGALVYLEQLEGEVGEIARALRKRLMTHGPDLRVQLAWGFPCWIGRARIASIVPQKSWCNLQLWSGARLAPDFARIEGNGKSLRHVKVRAVDDIDEGIDDIIEAAIAIDRTQPIRVR